MLNRAWSAGLAGVVDAPPRSRPLRVALLGFGVVGKSVARLLGEQHDENSAVVLTHVFNRNVDAKRADWVDRSVSWTEQIDDVLASNVDVMVEVIGGLEPAYQWVSAALERGISVVTANKVLIAHHGRALTELAALHGAELRFEASVAGGVPVINAIERGIAGDRLRKVAGILNGTCNFVLSEIASTRGSFKDTVARARELGYAEADPSNDLNGSDAAAKLIVLAGVGFHLELRPEHVRRQPITRITPTDFDYAARLGCTIRQVSIADHRGDTDLDAFVGPALVPLDAPLARVYGASNMVVLTGEHGGDVTLSGRGAGGDPTAVAVVSDLLALARGERRQREAMWSRAKPAVPASLAHYVRFVVRDRPGILASFASVFARHRINVDAVLQEPGYPKSRLPFVMTLEPCAQASLAAALEDLDALDVHEEPPLALPRLSGGDEPHA